MPVSDVGLQRKLADAKRQKEQTEREGRERRREEQEALVRWQCLRRSGANSRVLTFTFGAVCVQLASRAKKALVTAMEEKDKPGLEAALKRAREAHFLDDANNVRRVQGLVVPSPRMCGCLLTNLGCCILQVPVEVKEAQALLKLLSAEADMTALVAEVSEKEGALNAERRKTEQVRTAPRCLAVVSRP